MLIPNIFNYKRNNIKYSQPARMKKLLLLIAAAAPLLGASAQTSAPGSTVVKYELPTGTFYSGDKALLPAGVQLQWLNSSYYVGEGLITDGAYKWYINQTVDGEDEQVVLGTETDLTTVATFAIPGLKKAEAGVPPILSLDEPGTDTYAATNVFYGATGAADLFKPYPATVTPATFELYTIGSSSVSSMWSQVAPEINNAMLTGFAQALPYPGTPYTLSSIKINGIPPGVNYKVSVFLTDGESNVLSEDKLLAENAEKANIVISGDAVIVVSEFSGYKEPFKVSIASFTPEAVGQPVPACGLSAVLYGTNADGELTTVLASDDEPIDGAYPIGLDLDLGISYTFFIPYETVNHNNPDIESTSVLGKETINVEFQKEFNTLSYRCITNIPVENLNFTLADGLEIPTWLEATATVDEENDQCVIITFAQTSAGTGVADIMINNGETPLFGGFIVAAEGTTGIDAIGNDSEVVAREYFDITGRRLNAVPAAGFYIEKMTRADGTTESLSRVR